MKLSKYVLFGLFVFAAPSFAEVTLDNPNIDDYNFLANSADELRNSSNPTALQAQRRNRADAICANYGAGDATFAGLAIGDTSSGNAFLINVDSAPYFEADFYPVRTSNTNCVNFNNATQCAATKFAYILCENPSMKSLRGYHEEYVR